MPIPLIEDIRQNRVLPRWNLIRNLHILHNLDLSLLDRTLQIHIRNLFAQIRFRVDQADESVFDLEDYVGAFVYVFEGGADGFDCESLAAGRC